MVSGTKWVDFICAKCRKDIEEKPYLLKDASGEVTYVFCSQECALEWMDEQDGEFTPG